MDICRFDKNPDASLAWGVEDKVLYEKMEMFYDKGGDKKAFFEFVDTLIGTDYRRGELNEILEERCEIPTSTIIPQLGSTVAMAGALAAEAVARIRLGFDYPPRSIINKRTLEVKVYH